MRDCIKNYTNLIQDEGFRKFKSTRDQIEYILTEVRPVTEFREHVFKVTDTYVSNHVKSSTKSRDFRNYGWTFYRTGDYLSAHAFFIKAVLLAPFPSQDNDENNELSHSFAAKSTVEFELKDYKSSLSSAENSLEFYETNEMLFKRIDCLRLLKRYPESLERIDQLIQKRQNSIEMNTNEENVEKLMEIRNNIVSQMSDPENTSKVSLEKEKEVTSNMRQDINKDTEDEEIKTSLWLHPNCDLKSNERKGRHFLAKQFIPKDTVVLKEKIVNSHLNRDTRVRVCSYCNKLVGSDFWPCFRCTEVVFCSKSCSKRANSEFHEHECGFVGLLDSYGSHFSHNYRIMSRVGFKIVDECEEQNTDPDINRYIEDQTKLSVRPVNDSSVVNTKTPKQIKLYTEYQSFRSMTDHNDKFDPTTNAKDSFRAIEMALLFDYTKQLPFDIKEDIQSFVTFVNVVLKNSRRMITNAFGWYETVDKYPGLEIAWSSIKCKNQLKAQMNRTHIGSCFCFVSSLFNHSCKPNICWIFKDGIMTYTTNVDISAGQELCITYGPTEELTKFTERQQKLRNHYFFDCNCSACVRQTKTVLCIRCQQCSGPVVFTKPYFEEMVRKICCLECGHEFQSPEHTMKRITVASNLFNEMIKNLKANQNVVTSLRVAKQCLNILTDLVYSKSQPLEQYIKELIEILVYFDIPKESEGSGEEILDNF